MEEVYILHTTNVENIANLVFKLAEKEISKKKDLQQTRSILIKPNALGPYPPDEGKTTNPKLTDAICKILHKNKYSVVMGDCPTESSGTTENIFLKTKLLNKTTQNFYKNIGESVSNIHLDCLSDKENLCVASFALDADLVISAAKAKTSCYMIISGAVKNLYGIIPGVLKARLHEVFQERDDFAQMLIELAQSPRATMAVIDGSTIMEGNGPTHGKPRTENLYIVSTNIYAADFALAVLMGLTPEQVPTLKLSLREGLFSPDKLKIISNIKFEKLNDFKLPITVKSYMNGEKIVLDPTVKKIASVKIIFDHKKCIHCGICKKACPVNAISLNPFPKIDYDKCINCFCCNELCTEGAALPEADIKKLWDKLLSTEAKNNIKLSRKDKSSTKE